MKKQQENQRLNEIKNSLRKIELESDSSKDLTFKKPSSNHLKQQEIDSPTTPKFIPTTKDNFQKIKGMESQDGHPSFKNISFVNSQKNIVRNYQSPIPQGRKIDREKSKFSIPSIGILVNDNIPNFPSFKGPSSTDQVPIQNMTSFQFKNQAMVNTAKKESTEDKCYYENSRVASSNNRTSDQETGIFQRQSEDDVLSLGAGNNKNPYLNIDSKNNKCGFYEENLDTGRSESNVKDTSRGDNRPDLKIPVFKCKTKSSLS